MIIEMTAPPTQKDTYWPPPQGHWTYADYARLPDNGFSYEVIRGELYMSPAPPPEHQEVVTSLTSELFHFVRKQNLGKVFASPIDVNITTLAKLKSTFCADRFTLCLVNLVPMTKPAQRLYQGLA